ncbi:MAG TPA: serine/threonine-protein kinase, partial [Kofleriaceae bacterium]|nr:serine/threonine-protein kinase [Kofleriaceae bacterium]
MADVLLGRTDGIEGFERHVVLKRIRPEHAKDQHFIHMFLDEARVAATLHHANIVQVHDIGENRGEYFFAMEYLHGEDLRKMLSVVSKNKTHMPLAHVVAIVSAAAAGLHYAHERKGSDKKPLNIVHRDVSPSNIIVGYDGSVKVVDFGIAKAAMRQLETRSGSLKGKVSYMSPEQCKGDPIDRRSDVYALGVLLYELSTTSRLFKGENDYLMMDAIVNGKIPLPRVRRPDLPNELSSIIMRCLSVDPMRRFQTADELRVALDQFAANAGMTTSQSALATYMRKLFGDKPEPWLDGTTSSRPELNAPPAEDDAVRNSWSDIAQDDTAAPSQPPTSIEVDKTRSSRKMVAAAQSQAHAQASKSGRVATIPPRETRTSMQMGWEQTPGEEMPASAPAKKRGKWVALAAVPLLAAAGFGVWQVALKDKGQPTTTAAVAPAPPPRAPTISPIDPPATP